MDVSRRKFLGAISASVAAMLSLGRTADGGSRWLGLIDRGAKTPIPADALSQLGWSSFYQQLYTDFEFSNLLAGRLFARPTMLRLASIKDTDLFRKGGTVTDPRCFVLTFTAQSMRSTQLRQDTYGVDHFALGRFELFISDADLTGGVPVYTAVINRILE